MAVWNGLVGGAHWSAVKMFLHLASAPDPQGIVQQIRSGGLLRRDELHTMLTWQGWNIVEGPGGHFRADDPGEAFFLSGRCPDQPSSETIPSVSPVPVQPS